MRIRSVFSGRFGILTAALLIVAGLAGPARAQMNVDAAVGLGSQGYYKPSRWVPVRLTVTNQGAPTHLEVTARISQTMEAPQEAVLPSRTVPSGANEVHTLYLRAPSGYGTQGLVTVLPSRDGRLLSRTAPPASPVSDADRLVLGVGQQIGAVLGALNGVKVANRGPIRTFSGSTQGTVTVATGAPGDVPDRWEGLDAADMVVLGSVSERDFTPEQLTALRDYAVSGGTLVVTGGVNWERLSTPFFAELLPVRVTGGGTAPNVPGVEALARGKGLRGSPFPVCVATAKPEAHVVLGNGANPLLAIGRKGSGRVIYLAWDPSLPPFRGWDGAPEFWKSLLTEPLGVGTSQIIASISQTEERSENPYAGMYANSGGSRLADAPFSISQLDIPAFYVVALFLLAYIIVLVPLNYYVLKARDKKEYAWLTTPAIVAAFSLGAYLIGYGFKGGRTLLVDVGVIEAHAGQDSARNLFYAGIFSPRKTGYDVQVAARDPQSQGAAATTLLALPADASGSQPFKTEEDDTQKVQDLGIDMWAMRVLKGEGIVRLGKGFKVTLKPSRQAVSGEVVNDTPLTLDQCSVVAGNKVEPLGALPPGGRVSFDTRSGTVMASGGLLPSGLASRVGGTRDEERVRKALLAPLTSGYDYAGIAAAPTPGPRAMLVGWVHGPAVPLTVNGGEPREQAATLVIVHLDRPGE